jgi:hypothetical protein
MEPADWRQARDEYCRTVVPLPACRLPGKRWRGRPSSRMLLAWRSLAQPCPDRGRGRARSRGSPQERECDRDSRSTRCFGKSASRGPSAGGAGVDESHKTIAAAFSREAWTSRSIAFATLCRRLPALVGRKAALVSATLLPLVRGHHTPKAKVTRLCRRSCEISLRQSIGIIWR